MKVFIALLLLLISEISFGCSVAKIEDTDSSYENSYEMLVTKASSIVLATVTSEKSLAGEMNSYSLSVNKSLKGELAKDFSMLGFPAGSRLDKYSHDFDEHKLAEFWAFGIYHNSASPGDCKDYGYFQVGKQYLIMLDANNEGFSFENVQSEKDLWLQVIKLWVELLSK